MNVAAANSLTIVPDVSSDAVSSLLTLVPDFVFERLDPHNRQPQQTHVGFGSESNELYDANADEIFAALRAGLPSQSNTDFDLPPGAGGGVMAMIGYEALAGRALPAGETTPSAVILRPDILVTIDHASDRAWVRTETASADLDQITEALKGKGSLTRAPEPQDQLAWTPAISEADFVAFTRQAQLDMGRGNPVEGAVLSVRMTTSGRRDPVTAYQRLRELNPSTYMFLVQSRAIQAWGATSLGLVRLEDGAFVAETDGATHPYEDDAFVWTPSAKEISEYDVVVGALRDALTPLTDQNGLTFASEMEERRFFNLAHLFATFTGHLKPGCDATDLVRALSPHGAAVGHHRQPALDAIAQAETTPRGPFAGTIGFFGSDGSVDASAFTRSMWQTEEGLFVHAGAKVVPASVPVEEYRECILKTLALRRCVEE